MFLENGTKTNNDEEIKRKKKTKKKKKKRKKDFLRMRVLIEKNGTQDV